MNDTAGIVVWLLLIAVVYLVIFLVCRELNCWYFKINRRVNQMDEMLRKQDEIIRLLSAGKTAPAQSKSTVAAAPQPVRRTFRAGQRVTSKVEKYGRPAGTVMTIDQVLDEQYKCSIDMKEIGLFSGSEIEPL